MQEQNVSAIFLNVIGLCGNNLLAYANMGTNMVKTVGFVAHPAHMSAIFKHMLKQIVSPQGTYGKNF
jgi:hypothetical protein